MRIPRISSCIVAASLLAFATGCGETGGESEQSAPGAAAAQNGNAPSNVSERGAGGPPWAQADQESSNPSENLFTGTGECGVVDLLADQDEIVGEVEVCENDALEVMIL